MSLQHTNKDMHVAIVGSGFGGIGTAIRLKQAGIDDFVVFERAGEVGGVWRDNRYPGAACDVASHLYSFSFAPNPQWSRSISPQTEILVYLRRCAQEFGALPHMRFHHEVCEAAWDEAAGRWRIETGQGTYTAAVLVAAAGALSEPAIPTLPGLETFKGTMFHSANWEHDFDLRGKRVAVIGTGASAVQFVPEIQPLVDQMYLFQRTPPWIMPRPDRALSLRERRLMERFPLLQHAQRAWIYGVNEFFVNGFRHPRLMRYMEGIARRLLEEQVHDPVLRAKLTPSYTIGCKRILSSNHYLPALTEPNVEVVAEGIAAIREDRIVSGDGVERPVDALIFGTGFHVTDYPFGKHIRGRHGRTLRNVWGPSAQAHLGTTVAGFPNFFLVQGPNTGLAHTSVIIMIEAQIAHIVGALRYMQGHEVAVIEPRPEAQAAFVADVDARMRGTVWTAGGCQSWYFDATGRNSTLWPGSTWHFRRRVARFVPREYRMTRFPATPIMPIDGAPGARTESAHA